MSEPEIIGPDETFEEPRRGMSPARKLMAGSAITIGVVVLAGVVWFAYQQGIRSNAEEAAPVIRAEAEPIKRKPEEPGGLDVPHQDKLVFGRLAPGQIEEPVEKLLPPPEEPAARPEATVETVVPEDAAKAAETVVAARPEPAAPPSPPAAAPPPPKPVTVAPPPIPAPPEKVAAAPTKAPPAPAPAKAPSATDRWRIQLASVSSRDRALAEWDRLKTRNTDLLGALTLNVESAKVNSGTFYRIQAGPLAGRTAASALCGKLKSRNQDCLVVAP